MSAARLVGHCQEADRSDDRDAAEYDPTRVAAKPRRKCRWLGLVLGDGFASGAIDPKL
jgi:hypothetical protein